jgi:hypothetical protein
MSEYQYYEFLAADRPLDAAAQDELRNISTRARIGSTSFVNRYRLGGLKADPLDLLEKHFDVFLISRTGARTAWRCGCPGSTSIRRRWGASIWAI